MCFVLGVNREFSLMLTLCFKQFMFNCSVYLLRMNQRGPSFFDSSLLDNRGLQNEIIYKKNTKTWQHIKII